MHRSGLVRAAWAVLGLLSFALPLGGCGSVLSEGTADAAGVAGAGIAGAVSANPTVGAGIGLGVASAARAGLQYAERRVTAAEQDGIATAAGELAPGGVARWSVVHSIPIQPDRHGEVTVSRAFGGGDFACKEIVFSIDRGPADDPARDYFTASICRDGARWRWATAEPATARWGALHQ